MLYRLVLIGEKRNKSTGSGEYSSLEKLCTCKRQSANKSRAGTDNCSHFFLIRQKQTLNHRFQ